MSRRYFREYYLILILLIPCLSSADEPQQWIAGWQTTSPLNIARAGAAIVKKGNTLYILGGVDGRDFLRSVEYTHINDDGSLEPWQFTRSLNEARGFFDAAVVDNYLYVIAGGNGPNGKHLLRSIERTVINPDGSLGLWHTLDSQLNLPRRCVKVLEQNRRLFALGGFGGTLLDSVESAAINADGTLGQWLVEDRHMTMPRYVNTAKHIGDLAIVIGGHREEGGVGIKAVETARLSSSGIASDWQNDEALNVGRYALSSASDGKTLWAIGGLDGAIYSNSIERALVNTSAKGHHLTPWQITTALSTPRANVGAIVNGNLIYIIGGTNRDGYYNSVEVAQINEQGDLGFYGSANEADTYNNRKLARKSSTLPNSGKIIEIIQTTSYTYLKVMGKGGASWLAAPQGEYNTGDMIHYSRGLAMSKFYSRMLDRQFDEILFVERVEKQ